MKSLNQVDELPLVDVSNRHSSFSDCNHCSVTYFLYLFFFLLCFASSIVTGGNKRNYLLAFV